MPRSLARGIEAATIEAAELEAEILGHTHPHRSCDEAGVDPSQHN